MAYAFYRSETVQASQISGTLPDFPALFARTHNDFRTIGNGGHVANASGHDLNLWADSGGAPSALMKTETELYVAATGQVGKWGKVASIAVGTVVWWQYGDSGITTSQDDVANTWPSQYAGVWHLGNGSALSAADSTGHNTPTISGATATTGQIDGAANFVRSNGDNIDIGSAAALQLQTFSYSAWVNPANFGNYTSIICGNNTGGCPEWRLNTVCRQELLEQNVQLLTSSSNIALPGSWSHIAVTYTGSTGVYAFFFNGSSDAAFTTSAVTFSYSSSMMFSHYSSECWDGALDEVRVANTILTGAWYSAEYNNQSAPTSFWGLGSEQAVGGGGTFLQHPGMAGGMRDMLGGMRGYRARPRRRHTQNPDFQVRAA